MEMNIQNLMNKNETNQQIKDKNTESVVTKSQRWKQKRKKRKKNGNKTKVTRNKNAKKGQSFSFLAVYFAVGFSKDM